MSDMTRLRKAFDAAAQAADLRNRIQGRLGKRNPDGSVSMVVSGKPHHLHVSLGPDGDQGVSIAKNMGVQRIPGLPVYMRLEYGELVIYGLDGSTGHLDEFLGGNTSNAGAPPHNHRTGSGLEYEVEALHLEPGRTRWAGSGMNVHVNPFRYKHAGDWETWGGGSIDLTSVQPATAGRWAWVLVGVDPDTNTLVAETGDEYTFGTPLTPELINDIAFTGNIPTGAIRVRQDDTALNRIERYHDARLWIQPGGDGGAADVGAEIDGAPEQTTLADTDRHALTDGGVLKWASWANIKATLQTFFDSIYATTTDLDDYALLPGRAGGQTLIGGTASGNDLTLESTSHSTKGRVYVPGLFYLQNTTNQQFFMRRGTADQSWSHDITSGGFYQIVSREGDGTVKFAALFINPDNGNTGFGGAPATSAALEIASTTGALLIPRMTTAQRNALTPTNGMGIYNVTTNQMEKYQNGSWQAW